MLPLHLGDASWAGSLFSHLRDRIGYAAEVIAAAFTPQTAQEMLFSGAKQGDAAKVKAALKNNADINAVNGDGHTALYIAINSNQDDVAALLVNHNADRSSLGDDKAQILLAIERAAWKFANALVGHGVKVDQRDFSEQTALHIASREGKVDHVKGLIGLGADPTLSDSQGLTPLHYAALKGHESVLQVLLREARGDLEDDKKRTPLVLAISKGHAACAKMLIDKGADLKSILEKEGALSLILRAAAAGNQALITLYFQNGLNPKQKESDGSTLLHLAIRRKPSGDTLHHLLEAGLKGCINEVNDSGYTPIFEAAEIQSLPLIDKLAAFGADPYFLNEQQTNLLHIAKTDGVKHNAFSREVKKRFGLSKELMGKISGVLQHAFTYALEESKKQKKPLLIILGETHCEYRGTVVEKIALKVAKGLGITTVLAEHTMSCIFQLSNQKRHRYAPLALANRLGMVVLGVDNERSHIRKDNISTKGMNRRNAGIKEWVDNVEESALLITGSAHLQGLMHDPARAIDRKKRYVVPICLTYDHAWDLLGRRYIQLTKDGFDRSTVKPILKSWN